jgi:small conductance mechanosensitive channel
MQPLREAVGWLTSGEPLDVALILVISIALQIIAVRGIRHLVGKAIRRAEFKRDELERTGAMDDTTRSARTAQRAAAIGSLLISIVSVIIWTNAVLVILDILGINITPILASAGVAGVALAFGAQTLVKDYLAGVFLIVEDQYGVGDVVELDRVVGIVEEVALRTTRVRDFGGVIWYVRNGEIMHVANRSQGSVMAVVDITLAKEADLEVVRATVETVGRKMMTDEECGPMLLGEPRFAGVEAVGSDALLGRVIARARPEHQITLQRIMRQRVVAALQEAGLGAMDGARLTDMMLARTPRVG